MKAFSFAAVAAVAVALAAPALAAQPVNAGFEAGDLSDWTVTGPVDVLSSTQDYYQVETLFAPEGQAFAQLTAGEAGDYTTLSQSFTISDASTLSFWAAFLAFDDALYNDDAYVRVFSNTTNVDVFRIAIADIGDYGVADWKTFSVGLQTAGDYTIEAGVVNNGGDSTPDYSSKLLLDGVQVTTAAVPEPSTWAMMIAGFGLAGGALRRRRVHVAA